jgi:formylglycine-generating enzyme required for sulfatase activity
VSWDDAQAYVAWMNARLGLTGRADRYRLMSEAEFEYANRAGNASAYPWGSSDSQAGCGLANYADASAKRKFTSAQTASCDDGYVYTAPVGRLSSNGFGLYDMAGNVWEWVDDCQEGDYSGMPTDDTAFTKRSCLFRVFRGGSWGDSPQFLRSASRYRIPPDVRSHDLGFRLTRVLAD